MPDILVVYYSRSGVTATAALQIAEQLGADVDEVRPVSPYEGSSGFLRAAFQATRKQRPDIIMGRDPSRYRLVVVGSPVWAGCLAAPMRTYLTLHHRQLPEVAAFCTSQSGAGGKVFDQMKACLGGRPLRATLSLEQDAVKGGRAASGIDDWARALATPSISAAA